ncbi:MAG: ATP-binding protein [Chitinivibrionia bacterium]|jgi:anti-sigma regulatory factor (Ser/Thr protein kinase)|nr:ATP-binding protein [Chitinivibrionia bacterium]
MKELSVEAKLENRDAVQNFVAEELEVFGCPIKEQTKIAIAVEEVFVNIANYAYDHPVGNINVRISGGEEIIIDFEDNGRPYNPLKNADPDITKSAEEREIGGLGVFMVKKIMDAVEYKHEDGKNILTIHKKIA